MSSSGKDDPLGRLLRSVNRGSKPKDTSPPGAGLEKSDSGPTGLNPLDLLGLPLAQRDLVNWLSRRKQARFDEIQEALKVDVTSLTEVLSALKAARHIQEALIDGEIYYRVVFGGKVSRAARGLPEGIWERVDLDSTVFLRQVALFRGLSDENRHDIANELEARRYRRNEVIFWQGGLGEGIYFIKSGIVGLTRLTPQKRETQILSYLKQGDLLGEYGLLFDQNMVSTATATALSEVDLLLMKRQQMLGLLKKYPSVAVELVQMLAQRLLASTAQSQPALRPEQKTTLCLVLGAGLKAGITTVGTALAMSLTQATQSSAGYTEYPTASHLPAQFGFSGDSELYSQRGYDIIVPHGLSGVPPAVRATLVMDRLTNKYANIVIGVSGPVDESMIYMLEHADQVVLVTSPDRDAWTQAEALRERLKAIIRPEKTNLCVVCNRTNAQSGTLPPPGLVDFDLPWMDALPPLGQRHRENLPDPLSKVSAALADQLGRTNQIGIFVPVQIETNPTLVIQPYIERTLNFLSQLFGSSSGYPRQSVSESGQPGIASEKINIIQTYVTKSDIDRHLGDVLAFVENLKTELGQEVMALEVNHNVMLV